MVNTKLREMEYRAHKAYNYGGIHIFDNDKPRREDVCLFARAAKDHDFTKGPLILGLYCNCPYCTPYC